MSSLPVVLYMVPLLAALLSAGLGWYIRGASRWIAIGALAITTAAAIVAIQMTLTGDHLQTFLSGWLPPIGIELVVDRLSAFVALILSGVALISVTGSTGAVRQQLQGRETLYYSCVLLVVAGLMGIVVSADLFNVFVHLEVASIAAYALVASGGRGAPKAALAYLLIGSAGASFYLMGVGFIYAATGTLNMADAATLIATADYRLVLVGTMLIIVGLGTKMALFPFHTWMPAAYQLAPAAATSFMAPLFTKISAYALIRVLFWVHGEEVLRMGAALEVLCWAGAIAIVAGGSLAFVQTDLRRLLVYSSIGQMGIVALGIGLANQASMTGAVLHIANDALMKGVLFLAAGIALLRFGVTRVEDLNLLRGRAPWTSAATAIAGLSLVGVPPLAGFFGKWYVLSGSIQEERWIFTAAMMVGSLASVGYVFRILERLYFSPVAPEDGAREGSLMAVGACAVLALGVVLLGLGNESVVSMIVLPALPPVGP
ncbi:monovalent cation/H+ antiporter subunit D family protein [soil metagenome]